MGTSVETPWNRFRRMAVTPHWCQGDPLAWWDKEAQIGIAHFAINGDVGRFNLAWWLLERTTPPADARVYQNAPMQWVILHAPTVNVLGSPLTEYAARLTLYEWNQVVLKLEPMAYRLQAFNVDYARLKRLAEKGEQ